MFLFNYFLILHETFLVDLYSLIWLSSTYYADFLSPLFIYSQIHSVSEKNYLVQKRKPSNLNLLRVIIPGKVPSALVCHPGPLCLEILLRMDTARLVVIEEPW